MTTTSATSSSGSGIHRTTEPGRIASLNSDLSQLIDTSTDTVKQTRFLKLMAFEPPDNVEGLRSELERVFRGYRGSGGGGEQDAPSLSPDTVSRSNLPVITRVLVEGQLSDIMASDQIHVSGILQMVKAVCLESVRYLMVHMFGDTNDMSLDRRKSSTFDTQMSRMFNVIDKLVPFLDTKYLTEADKKGFMMEATSDKNMSDGFQKPPLRSTMPVVRSLSRHMELCKLSLMKDATYTPESKSHGLFEAPEVRQAVFLLLQPWLVCKYVATFIHGPWNSGTWANDMRPSFLDSRNAELALYRMMMDMVTHVRMSVIEHPETLLEKLLLEVIEERSASGGEGAMTTEFVASNARTMYRAGMRTHVFEQVGIHDVSVRVGGDAKLLVVGGGGAGGRAGERLPGGGGGGGEVVTRTVTFQTDDTFTVVVGEGGASAGQSGGNSSVDGDTVKALGGGGGGSANESGLPGGSGGGQGYGGAEAGESRTGMAVAAGSTDDTKREDVDIPVGVSSWGSGGGMARSGNGGGGGGAVQEGQTDGSGGRGVPLNHVGSMMVYGRGGDGGTTNNANDRIRTIHGMSNTGGGGNGGSAKYGSGGTGGSGVVVLAYRDGTGGDYVVDKLERLGAIVIETVNTKFIARDRGRIPMLYHSISVLSNGTRFLSSHIMDMSNQIDQRKNNLRSLMENYEDLDKQKRRAYFAYVMAVVLAVVLLVAMAVLVWKSNEPRYATAVYTVTVLILLSAVLVMATGLSSTSSADTELYSIRRWSSS